MNRYEFWLASASPRRKEMLTWSDWLINLSPANIDESLFDYELPENHVKRLAVEKCRTIRNIPADDFVIAADTIVVLGKQILGKPVNENQAYQMLTELRSKSHWVMTAIAIHNGRTGEPLIDLCKSEVKMRNYNDTEIYEYIESGDPMDKAGAYAIQNKDFHPVTDFDGCMASVMGMPLCHLERTLRKFASYQNTDWPRICQSNLKYNCPITDRVIAGEDIG